MWISKFIMKKNRPRQSPRRPVLMYFFQVWLQNYIIEIMLWDRVCMAIYNAAYSKIINE